MLGRVPEDKTLEGKGAQENWLIFKDHLIQTQEKSIPTVRQSGKNTTRSARLNKELLAELTQKGSIQRVEAETGNVSGIPRHCLSIQRGRKESQSPNRI